jgi:hypothetical protein
VEEFVNARTDRLLRQKVHSSYEVRVLADNKCCFQTGDHMPHRVIRQGPPLPARHSPDHDGIYLLTVSAHTVYQSYCRLIVSILTSHHLGNNLKPDPIIRISLKPESFAYPQAYFAPWYNDCISNGWNEGILSQKYILIADKMTRNLVPAFRN